MNITVTSSDGTKIELHVADVKDYEFVEFDGVEVPFTNAHINDVGNTFTIQIPFKDLTIYATKQVFEDFTGHSPDLEVSEV
ncbi:MAG: hypothetical protein ACWGQW_02965 [bacterium]